MTNFVNLHRDTCDITFKFLDLRSMTYCSGVNRAWKLLSLETAKRVYQVLYQQVKDKIHEVLSETWHTTETIKLASLKIDFSLITSFSHLSLCYCETYEMISSILFPSIQPKEKIAKELNVNQQIQTISSWRKSFKNKMQIELERNVRAQGFIIHLAKVFGKFHASGLVEEGLIVAHIIQLIPTKIWGSSWGECQIKKTDSLAMICISLIERQEIDIAVELANDIPIVERKNQILLEVVRFFNNQSGIIKPENP